MSAETVICPACGKVNWASASLCRGCDTRLRAPMGALPLVATVTCSTCGEQSPEDEELCANCGARLHASEAELPDADWLSRTLEPGPPPAPAVPGAALAPHLGAPVATMLPEAELAPRQAEPQAAAPGRPEPAAPAGAAALAPGTPSLALSVAAAQLAERFAPPEPVLRLEVSQSAVTLSYDDGEGAGAVFSGPNQLDPVALRALEHDLEAYGRKLFAGIVHHTPDAAAPATSSTAAGYAFAQTRSGGRVRLALDPNTPYLHLLRWEALLPAGDDTFLALRERTPLARCLARGAGPGPPAARLRILAAIASPTTLGRPGNRLLEPLAPLDIAAERAILTAEQALPRLLGAGVAEYRLLDRLGGGPVTLAALREAVQGGYSALHLVCHGLFVADDYHLLLEGPDGAHDFVPAAELVRAASGHDLRLVVLAACQSAVSGAGDVLQGFGPQLVRAGVPAVIAMQEQLAIGAAQLFAQHFYDDLARSGRPDMALAATRLALYQSDQGRAWSVPALFTGLGEGRLFEVDLERAGAMEALRPATRSRAQIEGLAGVTRRLAGALADEAMRSGLGQVSPQALHSALAPLLAGQGAGAPEAPAPQDRRALSARISRPVRIDPHELRHSVEQDAEGLRLPAATYRQIAAALNGGKHLILIGPPGTAKTTLAEAICRFAARGQMSAGTVSATATADWSTFDTVGGYMPAAQGQLLFRPGRLLEALATGRWLVVDEINRADADKAFGELLTVLAGQGVDLPYSVGAHPVRILPPRPAATPERWWPEQAQGPYDYVRHPSWRLIGTMNVYDKASLFALSFAFMRRFACIDVDLPDEATYIGLLRRWLEQAGLGEQAVLDERLCRLLRREGNPLMARRALGPAILRDVVAHLGHCCAPGEADPLALLDLLGEALLLYVAPQLDGLDQDGAREVYRFLAMLLDPAATAMAGALDRGLIGRLPPSGRQLLARLRQLYAHLPPECWEG